MNQPTIQDQEELLSVNNGGITEVTIPETKDKVSVGWIRPFTLERATLLTLKSEKEIHRSDTKIMSQLSALFILNGVKIFFLYPFYWRYLYYIKGYRYDQLLPIIETAKKKVPIEAYLKGIILAHGMKITPSSLTREEIESIQAELSLE